MFLKKSISQLYFSMRDYVLIYEMQGYNSEILSLIVLTILFAPYLDDARTPSTDKFKRFFSSY